MLQTMPRNPRHSAIQTARQAPPPAAPPLAAFRSLLGNYIAAKDLTHRALGEAIFAEDAVLTFSIATDAIDFPRRVVGGRAITETLVTEFGRNYHRCRTYYITDGPAAQPDAIAALPWLVVMRNRADGATRIGFGRYDWRFAATGDGDFRIAALHIDITRMDVILPDWSGLLDRIQAALPYPWLPPAALRRQAAAIAAEERGAPGGRILDGLLGWLEQLPPV